MIHFRNHIHMGLSLLLSISLICFLVPSHALAQNDMEANSSAENEESAPYSLYVDENGDSHATGARLDGIKAKTIHDENYSTRKSRARSALASKYSSVKQGKVTSVKSQEWLGTCWAFGSVASAESNILANDMASSVDLSERHLAFFTYHAGTDPLGGTAGDYTVAKNIDNDDIFYGTSDAYLNIGGFAFQTAMTLAAWKGAATEESYPYDDMFNAFLEAYYDIARNGNGMMIDSDRKRLMNSFLKESALSADAATDDSFHLRNSYFIDMKDTDEVKRAIVSNGAVAVAFNANFCNASTNSYYCPDKDQGTNHIVALVGWDDDYDKNNFGCEQANYRKPKNNGAWLLKNSWGSGAGNQGYYWISYEDGPLHYNSYSQAYTYDMEPSSNFDNIYQYDGSSNNCCNIVPSGGTVANVFTAHANPSGAEMLDAVSFTLFDTNVDYSIQVYLAPRNASDPTSGTPLMAHPVTGSTTYQGYYTVDLSDRDIQLPEGTKYSVAITFSHKNKASVYYAVDSSADWGYLIHHNECQKGQSFAKIPNEPSWYDLSGEGRIWGSEGYDEDRSTARIKAFTSNIDEYTWQGHDFAEVEVADIGNVEYTGSQLRPSPKVVFGGKVLSQGIDYEIAYGENLSLGQGSLTVTGIGDFNGSRSMSFQIIKANVAMASLSKIQGIVYNGMPQTPLPLVYMSGKAMKQGEDYEISWSNNVNPGNAQITIAGLGNYTGTKIAYFTISKKSQKISTKSLRRSYTLRYSSLQRKSKMLSRPIKVIKRVGKVTYKNVSGSKKSRRIKVSSTTGKICVPKRFKKGSYTVKIRMRAAGNAYIAAASKIVSVKVRIK